MKGIAQHVPISGTSCATIVCMPEEKNIDPRLANGVAYFEQMLQLMPEDRETLEFLTVAYEQLGRKEDSQRTLVGLAKVLMKEKDLAALEALLPRLEACGTPEARALLLRVNLLVAPAPDLTPEAPKAMTEAERSSSVSRKAIKSEVALVELLSREGVLSYDEERALRASVEASPTDGRIFLISALQILEKENLPLGERCEAFLADRFGTPPIPLGAFDPPRDLVSKFPPIAMRVRGIVPFAVICGTALVAILNPADEKLRADLNEIMPCRFYLADPSAVESVLEKLFPDGGPKA